MGRRVDFFVWSYHPVAGDAVNCGIMFTKERRVRIVSTKFSYVPVRVGDVKCVRVDLCPTGVVEGGVRSDVVCFLYCCSCNVVVVFLHAGVSGCGRVLFNRMIASSCVRTGAV